MQEILYDGDDDGLGELGEMMMMDDGDTIHYWGEILLLAVLTLQLTPRSQEKI